MCMWHYFEITNNIQYKIVKMLKVNIFMKFQFKLWILICVNVYIKILGLVHSLHIRNPCNYINTPSFPRHLALSTSTALNSRSFSSLQEKFSSLIFNYAPEPIFNVLNNNICTSNVFNSSIKGFLRGKCRTKFQYLFINSSSMCSGVRITMLKDKISKKYIIKDDELDEEDRGGYEHYEKDDGEDYEKDVGDEVEEVEEVYEDSGEDAEEVYEDDEGDYEEGDEQHEGEEGGGGEGGEDDEEKDVIIESDGTKTRKKKVKKKKKVDECRLLDVYKNDMDELIELCNQAETLYEEYGDPAKVLEELDIEPAVEISDDTLVCLARSLLNRPPPPRDYFGRMMYELGFLMIYNNIKKLKNHFIETLEDKLSGKPDKDFKRNKEYVFGIEPLDFGRKVQPLSECSIRGFLNERYFDHLENMAKYNPKRAQKILTVVHRIHKQPKLISDFDKNANDTQIVDDVKNIVTAKSESYREFLDNYPDLKWPTNDDDFLDLYSLWYDPKIETRLKLSNIIKEHYLDSLKPESKGLAKIIINMLVSLISGLTAGKGAEMGIDYLYDRNPELMDFLFRHKGKLKYIFMGLSYLILSDQKEEMDYFGEVMKILYSDVQTLENQSVNALMERVCKGLGSEMSVESMIKNPFGKFDVNVDTRSEMFEVITRIRRDNLNKLAEANNISQHDLRLQMEKVSVLLTFKSFLKFIKLFAFNDFKNPMGKGDNEDSLHLQLTNIKEQEPDLTNIRLPPYYDIKDKDSPDYNLPDEEKFVDFDPENMFNNFCVMESEGPGDLPEEIRQLITNLRYINAICLPMSKTSVYRLIYTIGCYLGLMNHLPKTYGCEVLGYYISGEDFMAGKVGEEDDYSELYNLDDKEMGLPPPNVKRYRFNAMLMTFFMVQLFTDFQPFVTVTTPKDFGKDTEHDFRVFKSMGVTDEQIQLFRQAPVMSSGLDDIEIWAEELQSNGGRIKKENIKYKYGIVPFDEIFGETEEEREKREAYEIENLRDDLVKLYSKKDFIPEIISCISKVFSVSEKFLLSNFPKFFVNIVSNIIYKSLNQENNNFRHCLSLFNVAKDEMTVNKIRNRIMEIHFHHMNKKYCVDGNNTSGISENIREVHSDMRFISNKLELDEETFLNYFRIYTFSCLVQDLSKLDFTRMTKSDLEKIKIKYETSDIVLINALCELIKEKAYDSKRSLLEASELEDFYLIEKHLHTLLEMKRAVTNSLSGLVDTKYMYRITRAFQQNKIYKPKKFTCHEVIGTFDIFNVLETSDNSEESKVEKSSGTNSSGTKISGKMVENSPEKFPEKSSKVVLETYYGNFDKDRLKEFKGDWEMMESSEKMSYYQKMKMKEKNEEKRIYKTLPLYGVDSDSTYRERREIEMLVEKGKLPPLFKEIPTEFHVGHREVHPDYVPLNPEKYVTDKDKMSVVDSNLVYKAWVIYNYRRRGNTLQHTDNFVSIFPSTKLLVENGYNDWKHMYIRHCIRNDDINSERDWKRELNIDDPSSKKLDEENTKIFENCYEEELLRVTNAPIDKVQDDIGNTSDFFFDPFYLSVVKRIDYVFTMEEPTDEQMKKLEKLQKFLKLSDKSIEIVHTKCFSYVFQEFVKKVLQEHHGEKLKDLTTKYIKPFAQKLNISQLGYNTVLSEMVYCHLNFIFYKTFNECQIGPQMLANIDQFIKMCEDFEINMGELRFSFGLDTFSDTTKVLEKFIFSSVDVDKLVDMDKFNRLCDLIGLKGEARRKELEKRGIEFYFKYMFDHYKTNIYLETFDDLKNLHHVYGLNEDHFKKLIYRYRLMRVLDAYSGDAGFKDFNRCLEVLVGEDISKYIELDRDMRVNWLVNIMNEILEEKKFNINSYLYLNRNLSDIKNSPKGSKYSEIVDLLKATCDKILIKDDEIMEALFFHADENIEYITYRIDKMIRTSKDEEAKKEDENYDSEKIRDFEDRASKRQRTGAESQSQNKFYELVTDMIKIIAATPKSMSNYIKGKIRIADADPVKKILVQNAHSDDELIGSLKLVDLYLEK
ncbi:uncharacterized protein TA12050 [Theileria annulata]|uniref:Hypothetical prptein n=1 Tax=Theileria annulata TaxID=5874 RepID=Q4UDT7_THEAN|nr:uncharacterized protein TA12050 [Theileria annulata]CAI74752.1 hypothetical prptein [Theileria annulata]|eukprot:XP_952484.1 hypothetical prptein [Theileria annulata]